MQFKVPQFIDIEDKLFGPFTFRQFAYMAGGVSMIFVIYKLLPLWIGIFLIIPVGILTGLLTFYKINDKPFIYYLQAAVNYAISSKLYIWKQRLVKPSDKKDGAETAPETTSIVPMTSTSTLKDLAWSLDVQEKEQ
ncbi:MAG: PrgI family protein [Patescibacteria group bacterium]|nr:PrgI family protein [Patescibacteria group bacterium]